ncbi:MAG: hypothetical protein IT204_04785 [Fimbriimonadaceae bacterium]|nr:hypothetical protein [Fimbriimonadaceae bacterium]
MDIVTLRAQFTDPPADCRPWPFWFWNDAPDEASVAAQIADFTAHGVGGFVIHPRLGLAREVGYLSPRWFALCATACREAARLGLRVVLYDEGMYPSGCSHGEVTRDHPELRSRGLQRVGTDLPGGRVRYWRAVAGEWYDDQVVAVLATPLRDGRPDYRQTRRLAADSRQLVRLELPAGTWRVEAFLSVPSGGHARGVHVGEDDLDAGAPPAADLLNPAATARFLETTHARYQAALGQWFGSTVQAIFVDEPGVFGRGARRGGLRPWTAGLEADLAGQLGADPLPLLPALWDETHPAAARLRAALDEAVDRRLRRTFYEPLAAWCAAHGIALVGHPADSDDLGALAVFQWPGQDMVWRYVEPGPKATSGPHSTAARVATSAQRVWRRARSATEVAGAYGWQLTADELKWLFDWHLARGNDLLIPHAFYSSVRGPREYERPPCLGPHNLWWPHWRLFGDYVGRVVALRRAAAPQARVAVPAPGGRAPWEPGAILEQRQVDFDYVPADDPRLADYAVVVRDQAAAAACEERVVLPQPALPQLRAWRGEVAGRTVVYLGNEGEVALRGELRLQPVGAVERWDPWTGEVRPWPATVAAGQLCLPLELDRRECVCAVVDPTGQPLAPRPGAPAWGRWGELTGWEWERAGRWEPAPLGDWCQQRDLETYSGTIRYRSSLEVLAGRYRLDLGRVGDWATVQVAGKALPPRLWAPFVWEFDLPAGRHELLVAVTNSRANELLGALRPSGLLSAPVLQQAAAPAGG